MEYSYKTVSKVFNDDVFKKIKRKVVSETTAWYYSSDIGLYKETLKNNQKESSTGYFVHTLYNKLLEPSIRSNLFYEFEPIYKKFNIQQLWKARINLYPRTLNIEEHLEHQDLDETGTSFILYMNTNNGYTCLNKETKIKSIKNTGLFFPSNLLHNSTSCTDKKVRIIVNFVWKAM